MKLKEWAAFALLGLVWGSSFLWIKIAVQDIGPFTLVALRLLFGLAGLLVLIALNRQPFPRDRRILAAYLFMGIFNTALPFTLISWGETHIASGLASILNGTVPLFTIVIAHFWLKDEKITLPRIAGLVVGFIGVVILVSRDLGPEGLQGSVWGQVAVIAASVSYALGITFARRNLRGQPPLIQAATPLIFADAIMWVAAPIAQSPLQWPTLPITWVALVWLGLLGTGLAYTLVFFLNNAWGPTRTSVVTYVFPVVGLLLGFIFLREPADWRLLAGSALIVGGIVVVNLRSRPKPLPAAASASAPSTTR